jgi:hypothetical protein
MLTVSKKHFDDQTKRCYDYGCTDDCPVALEMNCTVGAGCKPSLPPGLEMHLKHRASVLDKVKDFFKGLFE